MVRLVIATALCNKELDGVDMGGGRSRFLRSLEHMCRSQIGCSLRATWKYEVSCIVDFEVSS